MSIRFRLFPILFFCLILLQAGTSFAQDALEKSRIDSIRISLQQAEATLERKELSDKELLGLRSRVEPLVNDLQDFISEQTPRLEGIKSRLEQLGARTEAKPENPSSDSKPAAKPDVKIEKKIDTAPAVATSDSAELMKEREDQERLRKEVDSIIKIARYENERAQQILTTISERRRGLFARAMLDRNKSILSPTLWLDIVRILPTEILHVQRFFVSWWDVAINTLDTYRVLLLIGFVTALALATPRIVRFVYKFEGRADEVETPSRLAMAGTALRVIAGATLVPALICLLIYFVFEGLGIINGRVDEIARSLLSGITFLFFVRAMCMAVIPLSKPNWRIFGGDDNAASRLHWTARAAAIALVAGSVTEAVFHAVVAPLMISIAIKGVTSVVVAALIMRTLRNLIIPDPARLEDEACLGPSTAIEPERGSWLRIVGWIFCGAIIIATFTGYIALGSFLAHQIAWITTVLILLLLVLIIIDEAIGKGMSSEGMLGRQMRRTVGLKSGSIDQISILSSGLLRLIVSLIALFLVLAPWGIDGGDVNGYVRSAFFGFQIAGVTISLSTIATALTIFIVGLTLTRSIQRWLETRYLPFTGLDLGLRNSIKTIFGYVGVLIASALAFGAAGLSLDKLTIVAGALSVGIGFGLQSIVNNFVSGLILLWERPLRVGDWIAVGGEEGIVKRINVRATEIETFDKASLIVPNSEFISGRVKNWVHSNRHARIIIPISVKNTVDPKRVDAVLTAAALAHREVLSQPAPRVFFMKITDSSLDFELRCFADVDVMAITRSELLYEIYEALLREGIEMPTTTRTLEIADLERLGSAIASGMPASEIAVKKAVKP